MSHYIDRACKNLQFVPPGGPPFTVEDLPVTTKIALLTKMAEGTLPGYKCFCICHGYQSAALPASVYMRAGKPQVARQSGQGPDHALLCARYGLKPEDSTDRGWKSGVMEKIGSSFLIRARFAMSARQESPPGSDTYYPQLHRGGASELLQSATLSGLLGLLLEGGGRSTYPGFAADAVRETRDIRDAAMMTRLRGVPDSDYGIADRLLLPNVQRKDWTNNNLMTLAHAGRHRVFAVCDVSAAALVPRSGAVNLSDTFGVTMLMPEEALQRAFVRFPAGLRAIKDGRRALLFTLCTVTPLGTGRTMKATVDLACLQAVTPAGVPCFSSPEHAFFQALEAMGRKYRTFVRCDETYLGKRPDAQLLDAGRLVLIEIFGFESAEYRAEVDARIAWYKKHFPGALFYWDPTVETLEAAVIRLKAFAPAIG